MNRDLTVGRPSSVLWKFCLPLFGSIVFQQLYNLADSFVAGKFIGEHALAAVGNSYEITLIFIAIAFGCNIGCSVTVSHLFGAKQFRELKTAVYTTFISCVAVCVLLMALGFIFCTALLYLINTPTDIMADSALYLRIYIAGLPFVLFYNVSTGLFSALGDSKTPFIFLACSSLANIGMDILFTAVFDMGVSGVAWATFICQGISCLLAVFFVFRRFSRLAPGEKAKAFSFPLLRRIALIAVPSMLQQSFVSVGNIVIQSAVNSFGPSVIAGYSAAIKLNNLAVTSFSTIGNGISNYASQNLGAAKTDRVRAGFRAGLKMIWIIAAAFILLYLLLGKYLLFIFLDEPTGKAMLTGTRFLRIVSPFFWAVAAKLAADGVLRGAGMMKQFMVATFVDLILRVVLALILSRTFAETGIWLAWPLGWAVSAAMSLLFYRSGKWSRQQI